MLAKPKVELEAITPNAELVIERAARTCYASWAKYNPPESTGVLIRNCIERGHESVLEHASATFRISGVSRVLSHELVRHRLSSPSQENMRYVAYADHMERLKTKDFTYVMPHTIIQANKAGSYSEIIELCWSMYERLLNNGVPPEDARYVLPNATGTELVITANLREWRHILKLRGSRRAHWEIREVAIMILGILKELVPNVFYDYNVVDGMIKVGGGDGD